MNEETDNKEKEVAKYVATETTEWLKAEAKSSTGIMRWIWGILALLGMGVCVWLNSCNSMPAVTPEQLQAVHEAYHVLSGEPCVFVVEELKK